MSLVALDDASAEPGHRDVQLGGGMRGGTSDSRSWLHWPLVIAYGERVTHHVTARLRGELSIRYAALGVGGAVEACTSARGQCVSFELGLLALHAELAGTERSAAGATTLGAAYEQRLGSPAIALRVEGMLVGIRDGHWSTGVGATFSMTRRF